MAKQALQWPFPHRGIVDERNAKDIPAEGLSAGTNMFYPRKDVLRSRGGLDSTYSGPANPTFMYFWDYDGKLYGAGSGGLYKNGSLVTSDVIVDAVSYGVGATPVLILAKSDGTLKTYDGSTYATLTGTDVPTATFLMVRSGRLYAANSTGRVYYSKSGVYNTWSGAWGEGGYLDVFPSEGGAMVDWIEFGGVLYIFKERGIYKVTGGQPATHAVYKVSDADKVLPGTVADVGKGVLYATSYGVFPLGIFAAPDEQFDLTKNVEASLQAFLASGAKAAYSPELSAYLLVNGTTTVWVSNVANRPDAWTKFTAPAAMKAIYQGGGLWFAATTGGVYLYDHDDTRDGTSPYTVGFKTGHWDFGDAAKQKTLMDMRGHFNAGRNSTATVKLYKDASATATKTETLAFSAEQVFQTKFSCRHAALEVAYTALTGPAQYGGCVCSIAAVKERK